MEFLTAILAAAALVLSLVALIVNGRSASAADKSAAEAERSATAAEASAESAQESVELARSERERSLERNDVDFVERSTKHNPGVLQFVNTGHDTAHSVEVVCYISGEREVFEQGDVISGGSFTLDFSDRYAGARAAARALADHAGEGVFIAPVARFHTTTRISWVSAHGTPGVQQFR